MEMTREPENEVDRRRRGAKKWRNSRCHFFPHIQFHVPLLMTHVPHNVFSLENEQRHIEMTRKEEDDADQHRLATKQMDNE